MKLFNYPFFKRSAQEKVWFCSLAGLLGIGCGHANTEAQTQIVGSSTQAALPEVKESHTGSAIATQRNTWQELTPGVSFASFESPTPSVMGDSIIRVVRVDPRQAELVLVSAGQQPDKKIRTAKAWAQQEHLLAAINASMYQTDYLTSVHHMQSKAYTNNKKALRENSVIVFGPTKKGLPAAQIADASCQDLKEVMGQYDTQIEGIRMLSCEKKNVWKQQDKRWSHAVIGEDERGNFLLIHCRSPYSTHDFIELLLSLPLGLVNLQYAEGGPEAQLYINAGGVEQEHFGSFETGFIPDDGNLAAWPIPNVIGVRRRE